MNTLLKVKKNILTKSFDSIISKSMSDILKNESSDIIAHNNGKVCRENNDMVIFKHDFTDGIYLRQMTMVAGSVVIGAIHKRNHAWFLLKGHITVVSTNGSEDFEAPYLGKSEASIQRVIYAHEESIFQNIFKNPTGTKDLDLIDDYNVCVNKEKYIEYVNSK